MVGMVDRRGGPSRCAALVGLALLACASAVAAGPLASDVSAYRDVLRHYALAQDGEALRRLGELETAAEATRDRLTRMRKERFGLLERFSSVEPDLLLPVFELHETAYRAYREQRLQEATVHARATMYLLCELYAERALTQEQRATAADLFATLGALAQETSSDRSALELFRRALALDPRNESALLGAAAASERQGRYSGALRYLERLYETHPDNVEGRLRLALNLRRGGRESEASYIAEELLRTEAPPWVLSLAYQSLADWLLDAGDLDRAASVLEEGLERFPDDPTLAIAHMYVGERRQPSDPVPDLDASLHAIAASNASSPRLRYALDPTEVFERSRERLSRQADASRARLAVALARTTALEPRD